MESQMLINTSFANDNDIAVAKVYKDYEYSGTNFNRPAFIEMIEDIRKRVINCIIVKDLSRFGREYIEMGNYIENVFPFLGVRFISANDKLDTADGITDKKQFEITLKNIINDMYAKDMSKKIKSSKKIKVEAGYFIGGVPSYGYKVLKTDKGQVLIPDEKTRDIVVEIFELASTGLSCIKITRELNKKNYSPPKHYYKTGEVYRSDDNVAEWTVGTISKLLIKEVYIGHMVQGKKSQNLAKGEKCHNTKSSEWIKVENTHEPIVSIELFNKTQEVRNNNYKNSDFRKNNYILPFDREDRYENLMTCAICGKPLSRRNGISKNSQGNKKRYYFYHCKQILGKSDDSLHCRIRQDLLDKIVTSAIKDIIKRLTSKKSAINACNIQNNAKDKEITKRIKYLTDSICRCDNQQKLLYERYVLGKINKDDYMLKKGDKLSKLETLKLELDLLETRRIVLEDEYKNYLEILNSLFSRKKKARMSTGFIHALINEISIGKNNEITINFKFTNGLFTGGDINE